MKIEKTMRCFSFQEIDLFFDRRNQDPNRPNLKRYSRPEHFAGHKCAKKSAYVHPPQSRKWLDHWCFLRSLGSNIYYRTEWKWLASWWKFLLILVLFYPRIITFRLLRAHIFGIFVEQHHYDLQNKIWTKIVPILSASFAWVASRRILTIDRTTWGQYECLNKGSNYVVKFSERF